MDLEGLARFMRESIPFNAVLGVRVITLEKGWARLEVPFRPELIGDPMRPALHGGVLSALADTAGGAAVWTDLDDVRRRGGRRLWVDRYRQRASARLDDRSAHRFPPSRAARHHRRRGDRRAAR